MPDQLELSMPSQGPETNDPHAAQRERYLARLREYLQDPEFRAIDGFPIGEDEDILALSDPPYYTACPNPFLPEIIAQWQQEREEIRRSLGLPVGDEEAYHREPYASDVSEGKNDPIYNAHSYHTKVPHKAIMRYILHYTDPGDIVLDGFCGTGMTGVAAQLCGDRKAVEELGYYVDPDGMIYDSPPSPANGTEGGSVGAGGEGHSARRPISRLGARKAVLNDLSPAATFVAANYTNLSGIDGFVRESLTKVSQLEQSLAWLYTLDSSRIISSIWSDVFICPECGSQVIYWNAAIVSGKPQRAFACPHCGAIVGKSASKKDGAQKLHRAFETRFDPLLGQVSKLPLCIPVQHTLYVGRRRKIASPSTEQSEKLVLLLDRQVWPSVPTDRFFAGRQTNKLINGSGISHICHMYTRRALFAVASLWETRLSSSRRTAFLRFCLSAVNNYISRKQGYFGGGGGVSGTLYTPSLHLERNVFDVVKRKIRSLRGLAETQRDFAVVSTQSIVNLDKLSESSIDYIFTDPPFGESLQYAELNLFIEAWLRVRSSKDHDCVLNYVHRKDLDFYSQTMTSGFSQCGRVLKPGRWITVEFHNSQNGVWNAIQTALQRAGLVVADVRTFDKQQGSFNQVTRTGAVKQDLVISAYKPTEELERTFERHSGTPEGAWAFVRQHLAQVPVVSRDDGTLETLAERRDYLLYDRMVAYHLTRGATVPLSASEFYAGLKERFVSRDGMYFLPEQVAEYDRARLSGAQVQQLALFVNDEKSAIQWLRQMLDPALGGAPQTYQEIQPRFLQDLHQARHEALPELRQMLEENFVQDDAGRWHVPDPTRAGDLEQLRTRALLREFEEYAAGKGRLREFRSEAVRAGFAHCWRKREYATIVRVAERLPRQALEEDPDLLMYYDNATLLVE